MDQVTTAAAASPLASSQVTETYNWSGRQRAQFDADMDAQAKATGSDKIQLGFKDFIDMVNPLQHIPVVSSIYQSVTGDDDIKPAVKTAGDVIYGGPLAGLGSVGDDILKQASGNDMVQTMANWVGLGSDDAQTAAPTTQTAANDAGTAAAVTPVTTQNLTAAGQAQVAQNQTTKTVNLANDPMLGLTSVKTPTIPTAQTAANGAPASAPNSDLFNKLQHTTASAGKMPGAAAAAQQKSFNPTASQFAGITPQSFKMSKDIQNSPAAIGLQANMQTNDITQSAVKSSNSVLNNSMAQAGNNLAASAPANTSGDTVQNPQSEFAQKMMAAMDRYEAAKQAGAASDTPTVSTGL